MSDSLGHTAILDVVAALLPTETVMYGWQADSEAPRPAVPYTELRSVIDRALGRPLELRTIVAPPDDPAEDVRITRYQQRAATVRVYCYGPGAYSRAVEVASGYDAPSVLEHWGSTGLTCDGVVTDASETLGEHHERVAYVDITATYRASIASDHYSIQTLDLSVTT